MSAAAWADLPAGIEPRRRAKNRALRAENRGRFLRDVDGVTTTLLSPDCSLSDDCNCIAKGWERSLLLLCLSGLGIRVHDPRSRCSGARYTQCISAAGPHPRGLGLSGASISGRSLLARALSSARRLAADGGRRSRGGSIGMPLGGAHGEFFSAPGQKRAFTLLLNPSRLRTRCSWERAGEVM